MTIDTHTIHTDAGRLRIARDTHGRWFIEAIAYTFRQAPKAEHGKIMDTTTAAIPLREGATDAP